MNRYITIACFVLIGGPSVVAQTYPQKDVNLELLADEIFGFQDLDLNYQELYENMAQLLANKISLNTATADELRFLNLLTEQQIQSLLHYRTESGLLISVYELQAVPDFDLNTIYKIISFVKVDDGAGGNLLNRIITEENNYLIIRYNRMLETKEGFRQDATPENRFKGHDGDLYLRFRTSKPGDFSLGFTLDKDAGETIQWNRKTKQYGFDFISFHAQVVNKRKLKNLIIGDYQMQFAQGLLLGGSFGYGKGSEAVMTVRRSNLGFLPYTSANEVGYNRGIAVTYEIIKHVNLSGFYSNTWRDGSIANDTTENASISSFQTTGFHRNNRELANRHSIQETKYGGILNFRKGAIDGGVIFSGIHFNTPLKPNATLYNQFVFTGQTLHNTSGFLNYTFHNFTFFSEVAKTLNSGWGITAGILGSITSKLDVAFHYRNYQRNFHSLYSNAFSENSTSQNESGMYWGWKYRWNRKFSASGYADLFRFPWLKFRAYAPSAGHEWLVRFNYQSSRNTLIFIQVREESKVRNASTESNLYITATGIKRNYWLNCDYPVSDKIKMKTRVQFSTYQFNAAHTNGMTILQDISVDLGKLSLIGRYALFDTEDYDNRQYVFERDVWLAYSLPAYSGKGIRSYILAEYSVNKKLSLWFRYARTRYTDRDEIGSGMDAVTGNLKNDFRVQVRIKL